MISKVYIYFADFTYTNEYIGKAKELEPVCNDIQDARLLSKINKTPSISNFAHNFLQYNS